MAQKLSSTVSGVISSVILHVVEAIYEKCKDGFEDAKTYLITQQVENGIVNMLWNIIHYRRAVNKEKFLSDCIEKFGNKRSQYTGVKSCKAKANMIKTGVNQILENFDFFKKELFEKNLDIQGQLNYLSENVDCIKNYKLALASRRREDSTDNVIFFIQVIF